MQRRRFVIATLTAGALTAPAAVRAAAGRVFDDEWIDTARSGRAIPLRVRLPAGDAPAALIVFSHGLGGSRDGSDVWGRAWSEAGFIVVHLQHHGSDTAAMLGGMATLRAAASALQFTARVADVHFVLDEVTRRSREADSPWSRARLDAIGIAGHSFGAITVQALAGKRFPVATPGLDEPRARAFIAFSPSLTPGAMTPQEQFGGVRRPFLCVTGSLDGDPLGTERSGAHRELVYTGLPTGAKAELVLDGADHYTFAGNAERRIVGANPLLRREAVALEREPVHHALVARLTTLWWRTQLLGDASARADLQAPQGLGAGDRWRQG